MPTGDPKAELREALKGLLLELEESLYAAAGGDEEMEEEEEEGSEEAESEDGVQDMEVRLPILPAVSFNLASS